MTENLLIDKEVVYSETLVKDGNKIKLEKTGVIKDKILMSLSNAKPETIVTGYLIQDNDTGKLINVVYWRLLEIIN